MPERWDGDTRGQGVGSAGLLVPGANELVAAFGDPAWVAEQPELHLRPHIEAWCAQDERLSLTNTSVDNRNALVLDVEWQGATGEVGRARAAVYALIGSFAEGATYVRQRRLGSNDDPSSMKLMFEIGTGELSPDSRFDPHGHVVVISLAGVL